MKYIVDITIDRPRAAVVKAFENPDHLKEWIDGLQRYETLSGVHGEPGAISRLAVKMGKREIEMTETILENKLPDEVTVIYEARGVFNRVRNRFVDLGDAHTRVINEQEFRFDGFMRVVGFAMPGSFKKQSKKYLEDFKNFVESREF